MVKNSGAPPRAHNLRALNEPKPVTVLTEDDLPATLIEKDRQYAIAQIQDTWIIQDEWWREEMDRQYYYLLLDNGTLRTVYHDRIADTWYEQSY